MTEKRAVVAGHYETVLPETMTAMVQDRYGPASEVLSQREVPLPAIESDQVLIRAHSSSVNAMDWHLVNGLPKIMRLSFGLSPKNPTPGADVSGSVAAIGSAVTRFAPGDEVFGEIGSGAYAEFAVANERHVTAKPSNVSFEEAAAVGVAGLTALQGLRDAMGVKPGQRLLINGASGGVGTFAIQIGKALGAEVTAVCSTRNTEQAARLGADVVVDYEKTDITETGERFDAMFDIAGNHTIRDCMRLLERHGVYVMVGGPKGDWLGPLPRLLRTMLTFAITTKRHTNFIATSRTDDLAELGAMLSSGEIKSAIEDTYPLDEVATPLDRQGEFHARAKTVINVGGSV